MSRKAHGRGILLHVTIILAVVLIVCTFLSRTIANSLLPEVTVAGASQGTLDTTLQLDGTAEYSEIVTLHAPISAPVLEVYAAPGDIVAEGDALVKLDLREYQLTYDRMQLSLDQLRETQNGSGPTPIQRELLDRQIKLLETELALYAERHIGDGVIRAGKNGTVRTVLTSAGQNVSADDIVAELVPANALFQVTLYMPLELAQPYLPGGRAVIRYQDTASGRIEQLTATSAIAEKTFDASRGLYSLTVPVDVPALHEGQEVSVQLIKTTEYYDNLVPRGAIQYDAATNLPYIYTILEREGLFGRELFIQQQKATILNENALYVAVEDFNHADRVVIATSQPLQAGQKVRVVGA